MPNRVILDQEGLRVSLPGEDVLTVNDAGLIFNSNWSTLQILTRGSFSAPITGSVTSHTVLFGKTYSTRPPVFCGIGSRPTGSGNSYSQSIGTSVYYRNESTPPSQIAMWHVNVADDRFELFVFPGASNGGVYSSLAVRYIIWDYDL